MNVLLWMICAVTVAFLIAWWAARPVLKDAEAALRGASAGGQPSLAGYMFGRSHAVARRASSGESER